MYVFTVTITKAGDTAIQTSESDHLQLSPLQSLSRQK